MSYDKVTECPAGKSSDKSLSELAAITVTTKIPDFWMDMPRLWFAQFDAVMDSQKQGDSSRFNIAISKLNKDAVRQVGDLILNPPPEDKFSTLKERLLAVYEESAEKQFNKLVGEMDLGSQRPSQLLREMSSLAANTQVSEDALRRLWISRLPASVRTVLTVTPDAKLSDQALMADKIMESINNGEVSTLTNQPEPDITEQLAKLTLELRGMKNDIHEIRGRSRGNSRGHSRGHWRGRGRINNGWRHNRSRSRENNKKEASNNWLCKYHFHWRARARNCEQPCNWKQPNNNKQQNKEEAGTSRSEN